MDTPPILVLPKGTNTFRNAASKISSLLPNIQSSTGTSRQTEELALFMKTWWDQSTFPSLEEDAQFEAQGHNVTTNVYHGIEKTMVVSGIIILAESEHFALQEQFLLSILLDKLL